MSVEVCNYCRKNPPEPGQVVLPLLHGPHPAVGGAVTDHEIRKEVPMTPSPLARGRSDEGGAA